MKFFSYWRSTTSFRVRAALNIKGLHYDEVPVDLLKGAQRATQYTALNPVQGVPTLVLENGAALTQSMAVLEWLEEVYPTPPLLPADALERAQVRAASLVLAVDVHPVINLKVLLRLQDMGHDQDEVVAWMHHWMRHGFNAFQSLIRNDTTFSFGETPGMADLCLTGQLINARRWGVDMTPFARLDGIDAACRDIPEIARALPQAPVEQEGRTT